MTLTDTGHISGLNSSLRVFSYLSSVRLKKTICENTLTLHEPREKNVTFKAS